jgi:hypothetical protein
LYIVLVGEELIELLLVGSVGSLHLPIELWSPRFDVHMAHPLVRDVPVEQRLELMSAIGSDRVDPEGELLNDILDEVDGILLGVAPIDLQRANTGGVINGRILEAADLPAVLSLERQELDIDLDVMTGHLLGVAMGMHRTSPHSARKPVHPMPAQDAVHAGIGDLHPVVALEIPDDANGPQVVGAAQMEDLLDNLGRRTQLEVDRTRLLVHQTLIPVGLVGLLPEVERRPASRGRKPISIPRSIGRSYGCSRFALRALAPASCVEYPVAPLSSLTSSIQTPELISCVQGGR